jgi:hypothetical protein
VLSPRGGRDGCWQDVSEAVVIEYFRAERVAAHKGGSHQAMGINHRIGILSKYSMTYRRIK